MIILVNYLSNISLITGFIIFIGLSRSAQCITCPEMKVSGAQYWPEYNGLYDILSEEKCYGRVVYQLRTNITADMKYIFFYRLSNTRYGWFIGPDKCLHTSAYIYGWNSNRRPDYILRTWLELNSNFAWVHNSALSVRCTDGLTFEAVIGISVACLVALPGIIIVAVLLARCVKHKKKGSRPDSQQSNLVPYEDSSNSQIDLHVVHTSLPETGLDSSAFQLPSTLPIPQYWLEPPPYEGPAPPYELEPSGISLSPVVPSTEDNHFPKPPPYEEVIQDGEPLHGEAIQESVPVHGEAIQESEPVHGEAIQESVPVHREAIQESEPVHREAIQESEPAHGEAIQESEPVYETSSF